MSNWKEELFKLSGLVYSQGSYTVDEARAKFSVDPLLFPSYILINRNGLCIWTAKAERLYQRHIAQVKANYASLGIA